MAAPYATVEDMRLALGDRVLRAIGDFTGDLEEDSAQVTRAIAEASSLADTYLDAVTVPDPAPFVLRRAVVDVAAHYLRSAQDRTTESSLAAYMAAIRWFEAVSAGKASLGPVPETPPTIDTYLDPGDPETEGLERIWSRKSARGVF